MPFSTSTVIKSAKFLGRLVALLFFPITVPVAVATNYRGAADRLASLPGIRRGGGVVAGISVLAYLVIVIGIAGGTGILAISGENGPEGVATNASGIEKVETVETLDTTPDTTPESGLLSTPDRPVPTSTTTVNSNSREETEPNQYDLLLSNVEEVYPETARDSYNKPYLTFLGGSYDQQHESVTLNFSVDPLNSIDRYESAVSRTAGIYVWSHFNSDTAYPETITINYFRDGKLNATANVRSRWMRQYAFGNISSESPAPMSYHTYVQAVVGTLRVKGEKAEFPHLLNRCESMGPVQSGECKNSLRNRMPVRYYLPERTATGNKYTNVMGNAQPAGSFDSRQERLEYTAQKLEENITGTVSLEGYTAADEDDVWEDVDMRIRDVYLENETIVVEQYTRSEVGDDSLPLRQNDVIGAKYGRLVVNYGAQFMPADGVVIIKYTPDGHKYSKIRVQNYNAVGYINGERSLVRLGLDVEVIEQYQEPGS
jgi:hypothetical protein